MSFTLREIDQAFKEIWLHSELLPTFLEKWQEMVSEYLSEIEPNESNLTEFEQRMDHWQSVLEENRTLIEAHQASLKEAIKSGEPNAKKSEQSKKYKH
jgi:DNA repair ATPase RecN